MTITASGLHPLNATSNFKQRHLLSLKGKRTGCIYIHHAPGKPGSTLNPTQIHLPTTSPYTLTGADSTLGQIASGGNNTGDGLQQRHAYRPTAHLLDWGTRSTERPRIHLLRHGLKHLRQPCLRPAPSFGSSSLSDRPRHSPPAVLNTDWDATRKETLTLAAKCSGPGRPHELLQ